MKTITVIIATPSPIDRSRFAKTLADCPGVKVLAQVGDLSQAYTEAEAKEPDLVIIAQEFIAVDEFRCMKSVFYAVGARWVPIGVASRPRGMILFDDGSLAPEPVVQPGMDASSLLHELQMVMAIKRNRVPLVTKAAPPQRPTPKSEKLVLIGASTGGIDALLTVLAGFPADCPPTAIVQHTGQSFSESLIRLLDRRCAARVVAAEDGMALTTGMVCVAGHQPGHLRLRNSGGFKCAITEGAAISGHMPSVDALFQSAVGFAPRVVAALLTGMGRDGAAGLLDLHKAGAMTIGQNEATSVVYGMPRVAWEIGAVRHQLALDKIGPELLRLATEPASDRVSVR